MTSNEIAQQSDSTIDLLPPAQAPTSQARAMLAEHARMYSDASNLAAALVRTTMVPKRFFGKAGDATAAILYGAELGLNPIQSLQRVVAIHGMPSLEARTMVGLLKARGFGFRTFEQSDKVVEIWCWEPTSPKVYGTDPDDKVNFGKRINPDATSRWAIERAKQAGYVPTPAPGVTAPDPTRDDDWVTITKTWDGKAKKSVVGNMKYITDPQTMLKAKAQAEVCRELAPDVLMGISYTREDLESEQLDPFDNRDPGPARTRSPRVTVDEIMAEEVPVPEPAAAGNQPYVDAAESAATAFPDAPDSGVAEDQAAPATSDPEPKPEPEQVTPPAKKAPAKKAAPREVSKLRAPLEKRLFPLLKDAGVDGDEKRDRRIAVYRAIVGRDDITSTNDLTDVEMTSVGDQLYKWQQSGDLADEIAAILADAAREAEETSAAAPAADPTSEGTE